MGCHYWTGLVGWLRDTVLLDGNISDPDLDMFHVTDDVAEAVRIVEQARLRHRSTALEDEDFQVGADWDEEAQ
jgi:predicted Rossmann-fold nucleotide-binding protein